MAPAGTSPARPVSSVTRTTAWDRLPGDVQTVFKASYANRKPGQWIWYQSGVSVVKNVDVLHRKHPEYIRAFLRVYSRMKGVHLWSEVLHLRKISGPKGGLSRTPEIEFTPKDVFKLIGVLSSNLFCRDLGLSGAMKNIASLLVRKRTNLTGAMWREVVVSGMPGLHVTPGKTTIVHLDDKSPVQGRDKNGTCRYAARFMLTHASYDLWKWKNVTLFPGMKRRRGVRRRPGEVAPILEYRFRLLE